MEGSGEHGIEIRFQRKGEDLFKITFKGMNHISLQPSVIPFTE
jgi:hypothetical protein